MEWNRSGEYEQVEQSLEDFKKFGIIKLRTGISWADWYVDSTEQWYDWLLKTLNTQVEISWAYFGSNYWRFYERLDSSSA